MTAERWERLKEIFAEALEQEPRRRESFIAQAFEGDPELLQQARRLLANHEDGSSFLSDPAIQFSAGAGEPLPMFASGK